MRALLAFLVPAMLWCAESGSPDRIRPAAEKALTLIQASQKNWYAKQQQSCSSCHHQMLPALAYRAARKHGLKFDEAAARADATRAFSMYANLDRAVHYTGVIDPAMDDGFRLLAADAAGVRPSLVTAVYARFIALNQFPDGHFARFDSRPPQSDSIFSATAIALRAVQLYSHPSLAADTRARVEKSRHWMESHRARNTEERTAQLMALGWAGAGAAIRSRLARELLATQQSDGGWNSLDGRPSDAYSTGEALVALADAGDVAGSWPGWQRGIQYLLDTQQPDGSWHVASRLHPPAQVSPPYVDTGYPYGHDQFISMMGASYAVMALARALGPAQTVQPLVLQEAVPAGIESWAETVLFGTVDEVRRLLDKKFDPNSATQAGGTTALMMAVPGLDKTKLLIDRGANINARSKNRYSALLVAALYPGSTPVLKLLLDKGAEMRLPQGAGKPMFNATGLNRAAYARDPGAVKLMLEAGDRPDERMLLLGAFAANPPITAVNFDDAATLAVLLAKGAPVEDKDSDGITLLGWAAIGNRLEVARLLVEHGAKVDVVDNFGMTPLLYAASIDFGDSAMVDLLLKAGANPNSRTKEGLTAFDLAKKYSHTHLIAALSR